MHNYKLALLTFLIFTATACTTTGSSVQSSSGPDGHPDAAVEQESPTAYYDFDDVLIPKEMKLLPKDSLLIETPHVKSGVVNFEGRVEPISLFNFFIVNMPKDGWQLRSYIKYNRYIIVFEKPDKDCIISIKESTMNTNMEIWVTPRIDESLIRKPAPLPAGGEADLPQ